MADYFAAGEDARNLWANSELKDRFVERLRDSYGNFERKMREINERSTRIHKSTSVYPAQAPSPPFADLLIVFGETNRWFFTLKSLATIEDVARLRECVSTLRESGYQRAGSKIVP